MSQSDPMNDADCRQFDPAEVTTKDKAVSAALKTLSTTDAGREAAVSQATPFLTLARYIIDLCLDKGINLTTEVRRFEREIIERALELTEGNQKHAAKLLGLQTSTLNTKIKKYGLKANRRRTARR
jgi:DNA-binding NtrC family response regulator